MGVYFAIVGIPAKPKGKREKGEGGPAGHKKKNFGMAEGANLVQVRFQYENPD